MTNKKHKTITLDEIIENLKNGTGFKNSGIIVRDKITLAEKIYIIEGFTDKKKYYPGIAMDCTSIQDGLRKINFGLKEALTVSSILVNYANIDILLGYDYDKAIDNGIYDYVIENIDKEDLTLYFDLLESNIKQIVELHNNPLAFFDRIFALLIKKIPDEKTMLKVINEIKNIDRKKLEEIKNTVGKYIGKK